MLDIKQYKERVINHFKSVANTSKATEDDWRLLGQLFLDASENGIEGLEEFDKRILTPQEFKELYHQNEDDNVIHKSTGYPFF